MVFIKHNQGRFVKKNIPGHTGASEGMWRMDQAAGIYVGSVTGKSEQKQMLLLSRANRHGLIAGATGTGKTVTLQGLAEGFSQAGVPVFMADVKGDLTGLCQPSQMQDFLTKRATEIGLENYAGAAMPTIFWDLYGEKGHPVRTTISEMGPLLISRILDLNETQSGVLDVAFRVADDEGLLVLDLKDLRALLTHVAEHADEISQSYGNVAAASVATIQRALLRLEDQDGEKFFGEPALNLADLMRVSYDGRGFVNILSADKLMQSPRLYATFLLWMLSELFEELPEAGDLPKPKLVFFFDEAHLLFRDTPKALLEKIEQVVRLIRSKGVGIYFITQSPGDIPETILAQIGNKIQHALRAFTPGQQKDIKAVVDGFRPNPDLKIDEVVQELKVGEAIVSLLDASGTPGITQRTLIRPPASRVGVADPAVVQTFIQNSPVAQMYSKSVDRDSAYETLKGKAVKAAKAAEEAQDAARPTRRTEPPREPREERAPRASNRQSAGEALVKSVIRAAGSQVGRQITNTILRGILGGFSRR